jgi:uncharacterized protein (TIGR03382 family)
MKHFIGFLVCTAAISASSASQAAPPSEPAEAIVCRGASAEGFSYEWGGECWCGSGCDPDLTSCSPGVCTPNSGSTGCPDCTHSGTYGADCSGFVSKAWQVPEPFEVNACDVTRYVANSFTSDHAYWNVVPMTSLQPADAVASSTHVILVIGYEDSYGDHEVVEAAGCNPGIIRHSRTFSSSYSGARRINLTDCICSDGDQETEPCGDCGTRQRTCENDCLWSPWSGCDGPDPTGAEATCAPTGGEGVCATGQQLCAAGWLTCQGATATTEICDGLDNDCDSVVDNGTPESLGEGFPCSSSCGVGTSQCIDGAIQCVPPGGDTCDATDPDDGDGKSIGGCNCTTHPGPGSLPLFSFGVLLVLLGWRRRQR